MAATFQSNISQKAETAKDTAPSAHVLKDGLDTTNASLAEIAKQTKANGGRTECLMDWASVLDSI